MGDTFITVIAIVLSAFLLFLFPVVTMAERTETVAQVDTETITSEFISEIKNTGKLTDEQYSEYIQNLTSNGNVYDIELEFKIIDENSGKKGVQIVKDRIGENSYYSVFTTQIEDELKNDGVYELKEGDIITVTVRNTNLTFAQQMKETIYLAGGTDTYTISTSQSALVITTGSTI